MLLMLSALMLFRDKHVLNVFNLQSNPCPNTIIVFLDCLNLSAMKRSPISQVSKLLQRRAPAVVPQKTRSFHKQWGSEQAVRTVTA